MYKTINGFTKNKMIETIYAGNNGSVSQNDEGICKYRNSDGNKCAIGCFIPNHVYEQQMENLSINGLMDHYLSIRSYMPIKLSGLVTLQSLHDLHEEENVDVREKIKEWIEKNVIDESSDNA